MNRFFVYMEEYIVQLKKFEYPFLKVLLRHIKKRIRLVSSLGRHYVLVTKRNALYL